MKQGAEDFCKVLSNCLNPAPSPSQNVTAIKHALKGGYQSTEVAQGQNLKVHL